jgi:hypothetical protein
MAEVAMLLSASEGRHWRYEVHEHADGYLVHMRDLETGDLDEDYATVFWTLPVAFAYADMSAAFDRFAAAEAEEGCEPEDEEITTELELSERAFTDLSDRLRDAGVRSDRLEAWERARRSEPKAVHH